MKIMVEINNCKIKYPASKKFCPYLIKLEVNGRYICEIERHGGAETKEDLFRNCPMISKTPIHPSHIIVPPPKQLNWNMYIIPKMEI